jgi:hypothetical protein
MAIAEIKDQYEDVCEVRINSDCNIVVDFDYANKME